MTDMDVPAVGDEDVLVRVRACGICGSDIHGYTGITGRRIPPLVMGHEAAGVIERAGAGVDRLRARRSRHVRLDGLLRPLRLLPPRRRQPVRRADGARRLVRATTGATAPSPSSSRCRRGFSTGCPTTLPFEHAAMVEPLAVAVHAVERRRPARGRACRRHRVRDDRPAHHPGPARPRLPFDRRRRSARRPARAGAADGRRTRRRGYRPSCPRPTTRSRSSATRRRSRRRSAASAKGASSRSSATSRPKSCCRCRPSCRGRSRSSGSCASSGEYPEAHRAVATGAVDVAPLSAPSRRSPRGSPGSTGSIAPTKG